MDTHRCTGKTEECKTLMKTLFKRNSREPFILRPSPKLLEAKGYSSKSYTTLRDVLNTKKKGGLQIEGVKTGL